MERLQAATVTPTGGRERDWLGSLEDVSAGLALLCMEPAVVAALTALCPWTSDLLHSTVIRSTPVANHWQHRSVVVRAKYQESGEGQNTATSNKVYVRAERIYSGNEKKNTKRIIITSIENKNRLFIVR